jgi:transposase-like protein
VDIQKLNQSGRLSEWAQMVSQCRNSGKTVSAWCAEHGINTKTYYYRLKRICEAIPEETKPTGLPLLKEAPEPAFAEVTPVGQPAVKDAVITVRFGSAEMVIHNGVEPTVIEAALRALSRIC